MIDWWFRYDEYFDPYLSKEQDYLVPNQTSENGSQNNQAFTYDQTTALLANQGYFHVPQSID